jgi:hypothetical protein
VIKNGRQSLVSKLHSHTHGKRRHGHGHAFIKMPKPAKHAHRHTQFLHSLLEGHARIAEDEEDEVINTLLCWRVAMKCAVCFTG